MMNSRRYSVILTFCGGKDFVAKSGYGIFAEATLAGIKKSTNSFPLGECPELEHELVWEISGKDISEMKSNRIYMKVNFFSIKIKKEIIGYVMLDLRMMSTDRIKSRWYPLLMPMPSKYEPMIQMSLRCHEIRKNTLVSTSSDEINRHNTYAIYLEKEECFLIGQKSKARLEFELAFTLFNAKNLNAFVSSTGNNEFHFIYSLLGQTACSEILKVDKDGFVDMSERVGVVIRTNATSFKEFLTNSEKRHDFVAKVTLTRDTKVVGLVGFNIDGGMLDRLLTEIGEGRESKTFAKQAENPIQPIGINLGELKRKPLADTLIELTFLREIEIVESKVATKRCENKNVLPNFANALGNFHNFKLRVQFMSMQLNRLCEEVDSLAGIYLRYCYPLLGNINSIRTQEPIFLNNPIINLTDCFTIYKFVVSLSTLRSKFVSDKLMIEVIAEHEGKCNIVSICPVNMATVLDESSRQEDDTFMCRQKCYLNGATNGDYIEIELWLKDCGPFHAEEKSKSVDLIASSNANDHSMNLEKTIREREAKRLMELTGEFKQKQVQLAAQLKKKILEVESLKKQFEERLANIEQREHEIELKEIEIRCKQEIIDRKMSNRLRALEESKEHLTNKIKETEIKNKTKEEKLKSEITAENDKSAALDVEYGRLMCSLSEVNNEEQSTIHRLRKEISLTDSENAQLERDLIMVAKNCDEYKTMWMNAVNNVAAAKQEEVNSMKETLKEQALEIKQLRKRLIDVCLTDEESENK
ncbi:hypothetical protein ACOME3_004246 [Neoechinorhynchus agilis]